MYYAGCHVPIRHQRGKKKHARYCYFQPVTAIFRTYIDTSPLHSLRVHTQTQRAPRVAERSAIGPGYISRGSSGDL